MTNQAILTSVQKYLDDVEGADADSASVLQALRLATLELSAIPVVKHRLFPQSSSTITLVSGTTDYALPTLYNYNVSQVIYDSAADISTQRRLDALTTAQVFRNRQGNGAYIDGYTVRGTNLLLNGTPGTNEAGKTLKVDYSEMPDITLIQNDSTETLLGKKYPHVLIDMSVRRFLLLDQDLVGVFDRYEKMVEGHIENIKQEMETVTTEGEFTQDFGRFTDSYGP